MAAGNTSFCLCKVGVVDYHADQGCYAEQYAEKKKQVNECSQTQRVVRGIFVSPIC